MKKLGFGLMRLPLLDGNNKNIDIEKLKDMADAFIKAGGTYFDTAYPYHQGMSEVAFREAVVKRYPRSSYTVTDKLPIFAIQRAEQMQPIFDEQLERCGVDFFDYYWVHALGSESYKTAQRVKAFEFIAEKKREGKIRHIGFSFHDSPKLLEQILCDHPETEYVQLQINYLDWNDTTIRAKECYDIATRHGKPVIVMEPIKGGALANVAQGAERLFKSKEANMSVASWAVRFAASLENVMTVLSGMSNIEQMQDNISYMADFKPLDNEEQELVMTAARMIRESIAIPCTACRYCVDYCPKSIAIPEYFAVYNNLKRFGPEQRIVADTYYSNLNMEHGKASDCIKCGKCEEHCPQHLPIRDYLKQVASEME